VKQHLTKIHEKAPFEWFREPKKQVNNILKEQRYRKICFGSGVQKLARTNKTAAHFKTIKNCRGLNRTSRDP
jgi:hypothetical protein